MGRSSFHLDGDAGDLVIAAVVALPVLFEGPVLLGHLAEVLHLGAVAAVLQIAVNAAPAAVLAQAAGAAIFQVFGAAPDPVGQGGDEVFPGLLEAALAQIVAQSRVLD